MRILPSARHRIATVGVALVAVGMVAAPVPAATAERTAADDGPALVTRSGSQLLLDGHPFRFGAANEYWLGLDENVGGIDYPTDFRIRDGLQTAKDMGATVIRAHTLGVSTALPQSVEPALGQFNEAAFRTIDYSIYQARRIGLRGRVLRRPGRDRRVRGLHRPPAQPRERLHRRRVEGRPDDHGVGAR
jgi:mannan endo-1,4-beta-mannosidase